MFSFHFTIRAKQRHTPEESTNKLPIGHRLYSAICRGVVWNNGINTMIKSNKQSCYKIKETFPQYIHVSCINTPFLEKKTKRI